MKLSDLIKQKQEELRELQSQLYLILQQYRDEKTQFGDGVYRNGDKWCIMTTGYDGIELEFFPVEPDEDGECWSIPYPSSEDTWMFKIVNHLNLDI